MAGVNTTPWNDGASIGPWTRLAPATMAQNGSSPSLGALQQSPAPQNALTQEISLPINEAHQIMQSDSPWQGTSLSAPQRSFPVTSGLGGGPQSSTYYDYKSRGFGNDLSTFLGKYNMDSILAQQAADAQARAAQQQQGQGQTGSDSIGSPGGAYANVDRWNAQITAAQQKVASQFGITVPANVIKAVMMLESGGDMVGCNSSGYCGLMQTGSGSNVADFNAGYNATVEGNLYYGIQELGNWYKAVGTGNWIDAAAAYFSGYNYDNPGVSDSNGTTVAQYRAQIQRYLSDFNNASNSRPLGGGGGTADKVALQSMFPSGTPQHDFGVTSGNGLYGYGTEYGLNGVQHTGMDIGAPLGSTFYAPGTGTVVCVGCWRNDHMTGGVGRIEVEMPDGVHILYDHTNQSFVQVGQHVQAGTALGTNGGMNNFAHTHLEVRVPDRTTSSGWRLIDPDQYFAGGSSMSYSSTGGYTPAAAQPMTAYQRALQSLYGRFW